LPLPATQTDAQANETRRSNVEILQHSAICTHLLVHIGEIDRVGHSTASTPKKAVEVSIGLAWDERSGHPSQHQQPDSYECDNLGKSHDLCSIELTAEVQ